jgi:hypothetical protein
MKKSLNALFLLFLILIAGCSEKGMAGEKPPVVMIEIGNETYKTTLGTYCWQGGGQGICVDTAGPLDLLEGKTPIQVNPGEEVRLTMDYDPKPNEVHLTQMNGNKEVEVVVENNRFTVQKEKGIYYYSYGVWWMDEKQANVSNGDAFYAFALEVN